MEALLGEVASLIRGVTYKPTDLVDESASSVACFRTKNVQAHLDRSDVLYLPRGFVKNSDQFLRAGDVLISSANSWNLVGKCCWIPALRRTSTFGGFVTVLRSHDERLDARYLYRWFNSPRIQATVRSFGNKTTSISNLSLKRTAALRIPLPPVDGQRRIADILDGADAFRTKRREAIHHFASLRQSIFHEMFGSPSRNEHGWEVRALGDVLVGAQYGTSSKSSPIGTVPVLRMGNMTYEGQLDLTNLKYLVEGFQRSEKFALRRGDVLFNRTNSAEMVGKTALFDEEGEYSFAGYLIRLRCGPRLEPQYLTTFMNVPDTKTKLRAMCKSIVGMANINAKEVQAMSIMVPPMERQREFARRIAAVERLESKHLAQLAELDNLFLSLQDRAFKGEL